MQNTLEHLEHLTASCIKNTWLRPVSHMMSHIMSCLFLLRLQYLSLIFTLVCIPVSITVSDAQATPQDRPQLANQALSGTALHTTRESLVKAYLKTLKDKDFQGFQALKWYRRGEPWIRTQLSVQGALDQALYGHLISRALASVDGDQFSERDFMERVGEVPAQLNWDSGHVKNQNECVAQHRWECSMQIAIPFAGMEAVILIRMRKIGAGYHLDQEGVYLHASPVEVKASAPTTSVARGELLLKSMCIACHSLKQGERKIGPSLYKIYGSTIQSKKGESLRVDDAHLRASIISPNAFVMKGYPPVMPSYKNKFTDQELSDLIDYIKTL